MPSRNVIRLNKYKMPVRHVMALVVLCACVATAGAFSDKVSGTDSGTQRVEPPGTQQCPAGLTRDRTSGICVAICLNSTSSNCATILKESYDVVPTSAGYALTSQIKLPACKEMVLTVDEFALVLGADNGSAQLRTKFGKSPMTISKYRVSEDNLTANVCYPLSPQLLQCTPQRRLVPGSYDLPSDRSLLLSETNDTIDVQDYFPTDGAIVICLDKINPNRRLRCNWIDMSPNEYQYLDKDNLTLWLPASNHTVYRPTFRRRPASAPAANDSATGDFDQLCFPLTPAFTVCSHYGKVAKQEFQMHSDHQFFNLAYNKIFDLGDYFLLNELPAVCMQEKTAESSTGIYLINTCLYIVSAICLLVAFVVHLIVPSLNYHAKPLLCHMFSMLVMFVMLSARQFLPTDKLGNPIACYSLFVITYLAGLSSFLWLNVLSFDLWSIFNNLQTTSKWSLSCCKFNQNRFYLYSLYAWCVPLFLCAIIVTLDLNTSWQDALGMYPKIPQMCWFNERKTAMVFFYIPLFVILGLNLILFAWTVFNLRQASKGVEMANKKLNRQLLFVCFKLFIVMGLCWILEAVAWSTNMDSIHFFYSDLITAVQGIVIFIIYICKRQTYKLLRKRFSNRQDTGRWTNEFNTSKGNDNRNSSSGITMNSVIVEKDNSLKRMPSTKAKTDGTVTQMSSDEKL